MKYIPNLCTYFMTTCYRYFKWHLEPGHSSSTPPPWTQLTFSSSVIWSITKSSHVLLITTLYNKLHMLTTVIINSLFLFMSSLGPADTSSKGFSRIYMLGFSQSVHSLTTASWLVCAFGALSLSSCAFPHTLPSACEITVLSLCPGTHHPSVPN